MKLACVALLLALAACARGEDAEVSLQREAAEESIDSLDIDADGAQTHPNLRKLPATAPVVVASTTKGHVVWPGGFKAGTVVDPVNDVVNVQINEYGFVSFCEMGSSIVFTVDNKGTKPELMPVTYTLVANPDKDQAKDFIASIKPGRVKCPPLGDEGRVYIPNFTTGSWAESKNYQATPLTVKPGVTQYTLCIRSSAFANINYICVGDGKRCASLNGAIKADKAPPPAVRPPPNPKLANTCTQTGDADITAKAGGCIEIMCLPTAVALGSPFHTTVRWCNMDIRKWSLEFGLLDTNAGHYVDKLGRGYLWNSNLAIAAAKDPKLLADNNKGREGTQCGEHTFTIIIDPKKYNRDITYLWKFLLKPMHFAGKASKPDQYPNLLGASGQIPIAYQSTVLPQIGADPVDDCPVVPDRVWQMKKLPKDSIRFPVVPKCLMPGMPWSISTDVHLGSPIADLRCNILSGTGPDHYRGEKDVYISESNSYAVVPSKVNYWVRYQKDFTGKDTQGLYKGDYPYVVCFLVPNGQQLTPENPNWTYLAHEYFLSVQLCKNAPNRPDIPAAKAIAADEGAPAEAPPAAPAGNEDQA